MREGAGKKLDKWETETEKRLLDSKREIEQRGEGDGDVAEKMDGDIDGQSRTVNGGVREWEGSLRRTVIKRVGRETGKKEVARS